MTIKELASKFSTSKTTIGKRIIEALQQVGDWKETTKKLLKHFHEQIGDWFRNLVMDTTKMKIGGKWFIYFHAADNFLKLPLIYNIPPCEHENTQHIKPELEELKDLGYFRDITTIDRSTTLLAADKEAYGSAKVQFCLVHLEDDLNKLFRHVEEMPLHVLLARKRLKNLILNVACADEGTRSIYLQELKQFADCCPDPAVKRTAKNFLANLPYYNSLEKLEGHMEALTTNLCENHIKQIKDDFRKRLYGFKSLKTAQKYIDAYWSNYVSRKLRNGEWGRTNELSEFLLRGHMTVGKLAEILQLNYNDLLNIIQRSGAIIIQTIKEEYPISCKRIAEVLDFAEKTSTVGELADTSALSPQIVYKILKMYGKVHPAPVKNLQPYINDSEASNAYRAAKIIHATSNKLS